MHERYDRETVSESNPTVVHDPLSNCTKRMRTRLLCSKGRFMLSDGMPADF